MIEELDILEKRINEVAALCRALRADNIALRQNLTAANEEKLVLVERINSARVRLQVIVKQLPEAQDRKIASDA